MDLSHFAVLLPEKAKSDVGQMSVSSFELIDHEVRFIPSSQRNVISLPLSPSLSLSMSLFHRHFLALLQLMAKNGKEHKPSSPTRTRNASTLEHYALCLSRVARNGESLQPKSQNCKFTCSAKLENPCAPMTLPGSNGSHSDNGWQDGWMDCTCFRSSCSSCP